MTPAQPKSESDPVLGVVVGGRYIVQRVIGRGGMGVVYGGVHQELERPVAIKVLSPAWCSDPSAVERFLREARTTSNLGHANIVDIHDLGRLPDGRPYLVMPLLDGTNLATLLSGQPDPGYKEIFLMHYPHGPHRSLSPSRHAELLQHVMDVFLGGFHADMKSLGDFLVA